VLLALSTGHKVGLFTVAAIFIAFAVASSFLFPRWNPDFPGRRLGLFLVAVVVLTVAMLTAVELFAGESGEAEGAASETTATSTTTTGTQTAPPPAGDAEAGKTVFTSSTAGCSGCHTLSAAGAKGTVGPDLDTALKGKDPAFIRQSIVDPNAEIAAGYPKNVMPPNFEQTLSKKQIDDLVALLSQQE
jgi:mono/diheme cytochrome c family protein